MKFHIYDYISKMPLKPLCERFQGNFFAARYYYIIKIRRELRSLRSLRTPLRCVCLPRSASLHLGAPSRGWRWRLRRLLPPLACGGCGPAHANGGCQPFGWLIEKRSHSLA